jgi:hypothetical protein
MADEFEIGGTDRPKAIFDLEDLISSGGFTDYGLETSLWNELAPELGGFDPNSPEFQAALDELIASGVANISTASAGTTKDIVDAILGTIDVTDGVSQEDINAAIAVLDSNLVTIEDLAAIVGIPVETISAVYEASKPTVDDSAGEWYDPDTGLVIPDFDPQQLTTWARCFQFLPRRYPNLKRWWCCC